MVGIMSYSPSNLIIVIVFIRNGWSMSVNAGSPYVPCGERWVILFLIIYHTIEIPTEYIHHELWVSFYPLSVLNHIRVSKLSSHSQAWIAAHHRLLSARVSSIEMDVY